MATSSLLSSTNALPKLAYKEPTVPVFKRDSISGERGLEGFASRGPTVCEREESKGGLFCETNFLEADKFSFLDALIFELLRDRKSSSQKLIKSDFSYLEYRW